MIHRMAGQMGADPAPWSLREWFWMYDGWTETRAADVKGNNNALRSILAAIYNTVLEKPIKPSDLKEENDDQEPEEMTEEQTLALFMMFGLVK